VRAPRPKIAAVLRSCELRALVELVKMQQVSLDDLVLVSVDCPGTLSLPDFLKQDPASRSDLWQQLFSSARLTPSDPPALLRPACKICEQPTFEAAQVRIELFSSNPSQEIILAIADNLAQKLTSSLDPSFFSPLPQGEGLGVRGGLSTLLAARTTARDAEFASLRAQLSGGATLADLFAACIRCHNCMTVCPICYCKTCVFKSPVFDHEPMQYLGWTKQKGAFRMPADTTLFHLTRLNHMALSCVGCGMCTQACPAELPVGTAFRAIGAQVQATFDYHPGIDPNEKPPLITFKADEWTEVGE
jgi:formate dehydrogenase subunit beta